MNVDRQRVLHLYEQLRDLRTAATSLPDALVLLTSDVRVRWCNPAAQRLLGVLWPRDRGKQLGKCWADAKIDAWLRSGATEADDIVAPNDTTVRLHITSIPYGRRQRLLLARDISRVSRLEQVRRDFVANVSHELRTPLTVIHGYLELLDPADVPALAPVLDEMRAQSQRMRQIVEDLLELSRLEMQQHIDEERVEMAPLLLTLHREAEALSQGRHQIEVEDTAGADLRGSARDLHSAFSNLVSNAVRYTPEGGTITIRWTRTADGAEYSVSDTGYGIPAEHLSRLTERFYRVSSSRSRATGGTGLGLSIVKHALNLHGAALRIESEPGKGSTFTCVFAKTRVVARASGH